MSKLTHLKTTGEVHMVDVGGKDTTKRSATAAAQVFMSAAALMAIRDGLNKKGDVLAVARIAGIQAAKRCSELIPLCHPIALTSADVDLEVDTDQACVHVRARCATVSQTGVEMEALTAASVAALTIYDMCKAVDKHMRIDAVQVIEKTGGKSGDWRHQD